ncbi:MAG: aminopeptidase P family protein [Chitinispirillia bacterium]|nr:aminopeptidase P family protein [Chitinispirillia bacterium]
MTAPRINAVRKIISERRLTHALVTDPVDVAYISGFRASNATLLITPQSLGLFTDFRYMETAREFCAANRKWKFSLIEESNFKFLKPHIEGRAAIGIQSDTVTLDQYRELSKVLPKAKFIHLSSGIANISVSKSDSEIASMKAAAAIGDKALKKLLPLIKKNITETWLARALENICAALGSEKPAFDTIALFGERSALPHGHPGSRKLRRGDFILIDFGCTVNGFRSDMTRTFVFGPASVEQREIYGTVLRAQRAACKAARAGMRGNALDSVARSIIEEGGYGKLFGHGTGHGVGLRIHEKPRVNKINNAPMPKNCVVTIEPGIYIPNVGGVRIEDMALLKKDGAEILTHSTRKLTELPV